MGTTIQGTAADGHTLAIYRAEPAGTARGAVVIVQEIFGVNSHIRGVCDDYAGQGYLAVAPALFDRAERGVELGYQPDDVTAGRAIREKVSLEDALMDVEATARLVEGQPIGVVGYCWGGTVSWVAATRSRAFAAAVSYYGGGAPDLAGEQPNCPVQLHFGEQDHAIPLEGVEKLRAIHPELPVYIYPAGHGFNCDQRGSYHAESARLARERTLAFLREHVG
ncbi:MAG TPA: dienelactone hydrolase family protein [Geminicoccaceae bacterium]|nr:dienelactone hydrolase family protein [Geminicoccaceae bacterium]